MTLSSTPSPELDSVVARQAADPKTTDRIEELYIRWKLGNQAAGQMLANRFSQWFGAVITIQMGTTRGQQPLQNACARFSRDFGTVETVEDIHRWAHGTVKDEAADTREPQNDPVPDEVATSLRKAKNLKPALHPNLADLYSFYAGSMAPEQARTLAPKDLLAARYALKRLLKNKYGIPFTVTPQRAINPDARPLPWYEARRFNHPEEGARFETWLLNQNELCVDLWEFAPYANCLRVGLPLENPPTKSAAWSVIGMTTVVFALLLLIGSALFVAQSVTLP